MNAIPSTSTPGNEKGDRVRRAAALLALTSLVVCSQVASQEQTAGQEQTAAVLKLREIDFFYRSSVAHLSCSALQGRVASILRALGAREDVEVRVTDCETVVDPLEESTDDPWQMPSDRWQNPSDRWQSPSDRWRGSSSRLRNRDRRREQSAHLRARLMMPVEVTPEVLAEIKRDKSRRELVSRVTGNPAASFDDPIVFPAQRQLVTLSHHTIDLQPEECELLEQMSASVFPRLDMRVVRRGPSCDRDQVSRIPPKVTVEALMPVMPGSPQLAPAAGESDPDPGAPAASETKSSEPATVTPPE